MENDVLWQVRAEKANFIKQFQWFIEVLTPLSETAGFPVGIIKFELPSECRFISFRNKLFPNSSVYFAFF